MNLMGHATLFATVLVVSLLVSRSSLAQYGDAHALPAATPAAPAPAPKPIPLGYHIERRVRMAPVVTGSIIAGVGYTLGALMANSGCPSDRWLYVPAAGPFLALATEPDHVTSGPCDDPEGLRHAMRTFSAILQGVGGALILIGVSYPRIDLVADEPKRRAHVNSVRTLGIVPALGPSTASVVVLGSF